MTISQAVALRIKRILKNKTLSAYRLEHRTGILHTTLFNILNAKNESLNLKTLMQICQGLEITVAEFFDDPIFDLENFNLE